MDIVGYLARGIIQTPVLSARVLFGISKGEGELMSKWSKQLSIPGLPVQPEPKVKPPTQDERIANLERRLLRLELEVSLLEMTLQ